MEKSNCQCYEIENIKNTIVCGNTLLELKKFPDESIDT